MSTRDPNLPVSLRGMSEKVEEFCREFCGSAGGNARLAAARVGLHESRGPELIRRLDVQRRVSKLAMEGDFIGLTPVDIAHFLSRVIMDEDEKTGIRLQATQMLASIKGMFNHTQRRQVSVSGHVDVDHDFKRMLQVATPEELALFDELAARLPEGSRLLDVE